MQSDATGVHVPTLPATPQDWHSPVHALEQQTLAPPVRVTQLPEVQSLPAVHVIPFASLSPQRFVCRLQVTGDTQSAFSSQVVAQLVPLHLL